MVQFLWWVLVIIYYHTLVLSLYLFSATKLQLPYFWGTLKKMNAGKISCVRVCACVCVRARLCVYLRVCVWSIHTQTETNMRECIRAMKNIHSQHTKTRTYTHAHTRSRPPVRTHALRRTHTYTHTHTHWNAYAHAQIDALAHTCAQFAYIM